MHNCYSMETDDMVKTICSFLEILTLGKKTENAVELMETSKHFTYDLEVTVDLVIEKIERNPQLRKFLYEYIENHLCRTANDSSWRFVVLSALLIKTLSDTLILEEKSVCVSAEASTSSTPKGILSVSQEKTVKKSLQFIIALGVLPNLLQGVGIPLQNRTEFANVIESCDFDFCPKRKYCKLLFCLVVFCEYIKQKVLQSIVLSYYAGDFLAMLFQVCYAPFKKTNQKIGNKISQLEKHSTASDSHLPRSESRSLNMILTDIKNCSSYTEEEVLKKMSEDRSYFTCYLKQFLNQISPPILMWQLLLFQGIPVKQTKIQHKIPQWLQKLCIRLLTENILKPNGVKIFIQTVLDEISDAGIKGGIVDKVKLEAVSRLISSNPVKHISLESYMMQLSNQISNLLKEGKMMNDSKILSSVASYIIIQFAEIDFDMTEKCLFKTIFKPLYDCLDMEVSPCTIGTSDITTCIEDIHEVFIIIGNLLSKKSIKFLLCFYHLFFSIYVKFQNSVSYLRMKIKALLLKILNQSTVEEAIILLRFVIFEDVHLPFVYHFGNLTYEFGDNSGIVISKHTVTESSQENLIENAVAKCQAVTTLLQDVSEKKLKVKYFLYLMKKLISFSNESEKNFLDFKSDEDIFIENFMTLQLLEELSEIVAEDLIVELDEAVDIIKIAIEQGVSGNADEMDPIFSSKSLMMCLIILSTLVGFKNDLKSSQWNSLKNCLPSLESLETNTCDPVLKSMASDIRIAIATHGAVLKHCKDPTSSKQSENPNCVSLMSNQQQEKTCFSEQMSEGRYEPEKILSEHNKLYQSINVIQPSHSGKSEEIMEVDNYDCDFTGNIKTVKDKPASGVSFEDKKNGTYECALKDVFNDILPIKGHGLIILCQLLEKKDSETINHNDDLLRIFEENLENEDSYIYLPAIRGLSLLADISTDLVLPVLLSKYQNLDSRQWHLQLKIGETLVKVCKNLGEMTTKYRDQFLSTFLYGTRHSDHHVRSSSLSNLGEVCKKLKFALGPWLQEILLCVRALLKTDPNIEVRRSSMLVITLLLQGTGKETFVILKDEIKELYSLLRWIYVSEKDDILKLHTQLALEEINTIVKETFNSKPTLTKEIRVLDPF